MELKIMLEQYLSQLRKARNEYKPISYTFLEYLNYYFRWQKTNNGHYSPIKDGRPWINFASFDFLDKLVTPQMKVFEFGAGGSSIFFSKKAKLVISIEHDRKWFQSVEKEIAKYHLSNWTGYCIEPIEIEKNNLELLDVANPQNYLSGDIQYQNFSFKAYASYIDNYDDEFFDIVFVDGRARPSCLKHSIAKVKKGGYLVLDNADIDYYTTFFDKTQLNGQFKVIFDKYGAGPYSSLFWETIVWKKIN